MLGAEVIADVPDAGLNPALAYAATLLRTRGSAASLPGVAALPADLPALRTDELTDALRQAEEAAGSRGEDRRAFVADAAGTGTVLLAALARRVARAVLRRAVGRRPRRQRRGRAHRGVAEPAPRRGHRGRSGRGLRARRGTAHGGGSRHPGPTGVVSAGPDPDPTGG
jgi:2-phospho-L-lactate guanylyltransferase